MPNQDRQIYNKQTTEDTKTAKVVTGEEQPMDVVAAARRDAPRVAGVTDASRSGDRAARTTADGHRDLEEPEEQARGVRCLDADLRRCQPTSLVAGRHRDLTEPPAVETRRSLGRRRR